VNGKEEEEEEEEEEEMHSQINLFFFRDITYLLGIPVSAFICNLDQSKKTPNVPNDVIIVLCMKHLSSEGSDDYISLCAV
jgi:hypothetical protein